MQIDSGTACVYDLTLPSEDDMSTCVPRCHSAAASATRRAQVVFAKPCVGPAHRWRFKMKGFDNESKGGRELNGDLDKLREMTGQVRGARRSHH